MSSTFFGASQTKQNDAAVQGRLDKNIFQGMHNAPASGIAALAVTPASSRAEDLQYGRSQQFPGFSQPS